MEQFGFHGTDHHEIWFLNSFQKSVKKIQVTLTADKNNKYFTWRLMYIFRHMSLISS